MGFASIAYAVYDYQPQSAEELEIKEGELLYILEKDGSDDWWKARKKATEDEDEEPEGLIPNNYVEEAKAAHTAKALYDYTRQTDEEVSFSEGADMEIYDLSDPDWTLVGVNGEFGFAPANYIELADEAADETGPEPDVPRTPVSLAQSPISTPAANLAKVLGASPTNSRSVPFAPQEREASPETEEPAPALPRRPPSQSISSPREVEPLPQRIRSATQQDTRSPRVQHAVYNEQEQDAEPPGVIASPPYNRATHSDEPLRSPGGFHLYNISEMVSVMGRRKKMPTTLGLNVATGTIMLSPEKTRDGPTQEWTADKLNHYSIEGKHVFLELVRPSKSLDLHAGAKDTAQEIVSALGEIAGAHRAEGFKEVLAAASGGGLQKRGVVLYDFMAQGEDEVTVAVGDEIIILDDEKSEEWWNVRRLKNGSEGVMPSSYIEITGVVAEPSRSGINAGRSVVDQNRAEEERLARKAVEPKIELPARGSSLGEERSRKDKRASKSDKRSKPDPAKTRTWTDHSGSFKVEAQFIGISDGKINLHKVNGVKIAVPVTKMSPEDLDYVEKVTKESIDEHIPVADLIKMKRKGQPGSSSGASVEPTKKTPDYDWFDFFLAAGVGPHQCERYAQAMVKDSMDESVLPDITTDTLRTLGLKEGDALKVMKYLDQKYRANPSGTSGIFSGPGGALHNNTRRGRPETNRQTTDTVDAAAFEEKPAEKSPVASTTNGKDQAFDDNAWEVKKAQTPAVQTPVAPTVPASANMEALSLLDKPLEPTPVHQVTPQAQTQSTITSPAPQQPQQTGANPAFFGQINQTPQLNLPRQRPQAPPQQNFGPGLLQPPPRPTSAPQVQQNQFAVQPLQAQHTGLPSTARPAPPGQSLDELTAQRMQQYLPPQPTGYGYQNGMVPQPTGLQQFQYQQPYLNGNTNGSPFADPRPFQPQPTGFLQPGPAPGSLNSVLPPALQPQKTAFQNGFQPQMTGYQPPQQAVGYQQAQPGVFQSQLQPQVTGFQPQLQAQPTGYGQNGFSPQNTFGSQLPPVPPIPQHVISPLTPQKTGPAPSVKFGVQAAAKKLTPQPTGRANLANATPQNPFGF